MDKIKVENHSFTAFSWFAGWLFTIGFLHLAFWKGLLDWFKEQMVGNGMLNASDLELMQVIDEPELIVKAILDFYKSRDIGPSEDERQKMLYL